MVDMGWNVWAKENRRLKQEYANRTPPTGRSGVTKETLASQNTFYNEVVKCGDHINNEVDWQEIVNKLLTIQPVQVLLTPPEPSYESGWKVRCEELEGICQNLLEWCQELELEIEELKREKLDKYSRGVILL